MDKYDIFISYRRSSYDTANLIATRLKSAGYSVFFDMETLRSGKFNEQLFNVIDNCKDFIVVLPPNALDRCVNEDDWVRLEVCRAIANKKNIVPVMLNGFTWPNSMPQGMEDLCNYQALTASSIEYFDLAMERLQQRYLLSKRQIPIRKWIKYSTIVTVSLLLLIGIVWAVLFYLSIDVCTKYATCLVKDANAVHIISEQNEKLYRNWNVFSNNIVREYNPEKVLQLKDNMTAFIDMIEKNLNDSWIADSVDLNISDYHSFLLSLHGINAEEIKMSPSVATLYYKDYKENDISRLRIAVQDPSTMNLRYTNTLFSVFNHTKNIYYASLLSELSAFPESSLVIFKELQPLWTHFPSEYLIGYDREYYENIIRSESQKIEELLSGYESVLTEKEAKVEDVMKQIDQMEHNINQNYEEINQRIDQTEAIINAAQEQNANEKRKEQELALRKEKINAQEVEIKASKAELEELDKKYVETYEALKRKCTIDEEDDQWYKWGKIRRWGSYLQMITDSRNQLESQGIRSTSSITPEMVYAEMNSLLSVYQTYHPESKEYVVPAKAFFKEVAKGKRGYAGIIVFAFKDDAVHPVLKVGDIIIAYAGTTIKNYDEMKAAFKEYGNAKVEFIRLNDGKFEENTFDWEETGIVGLLDLTE